MVVEDVARFARLYEGFWERAQSHFESATFWVHVNR